MRAAAGRRRSTALVASLLITGLAAGCAARTVRTEAPGVSETAPVDVLVQGAIDLEVRPLLDALEDAQEIQLAVWTFWQGRIGGKSVVVSRTEVGPINAAAAHEPNLKIFDLLLGQATTDIGAFQSSDAARGEGVSMARWRPLPHAIRVDGEPRQFQHFPGDETALRSAADTAYPHGRLIPAVIGSGLQFNNELDRLDWLRKMYGTASEDMESAFAAGVAHGFKTWFVVFRMIANSGYLTDRPEEISARHCGEFVVRLIKQLP